jgi:hypothetical protein
MDFKIFSLISLLLIKSSVFSDTRSLIGDYHLGFDVAYSTSDFADFGGGVFGLSRPVNDNFDLGLSGGIGSLSFEYTDVMQYDFSIGLRFHNKFEIDNSVLNSIDPFISFSTGIRMWQEFAWVYTGSDYSYDYYELASNEEFAVPWSLSLGAEFKLADRFSLLPSITSVGYFDLDVDNSIMYSITGCIFINENWSASLGVGKNVDFDTMSYVGGFNVHF